MPIDLCSYIDVDLLLINSYDVNSSKEERESVKNQKRYSLSSLSSSYMYVCYHDSIFLWHVPGQLPSLLLCSMCVFFPHLFHILVSVCNAEKNTSTCGDNAGDF